jgi:Transcription factor WhiB.
VVRVTLHIVHNHHAPDTTSHADTWRDHAVCAKPDITRPDAMFPDYDSTDLELARGICASCPVKAMCLLDALETEQGRGTGNRHGVRAGRTPKQRHSLYMRSLRERVTFEDLVDEVLFRDPLREAFERRTESVEGGHVRWTIRKTAVYVQGQRYTPWQLAFHLSRGRRAAGTIRTTCGQERCVAPDHIVDAAERGNGRRAAA